jgi:hypothetical protein
MSKIKFDETDCHKVIKEIESHFGVKLSPVGNAESTGWVFSARYNK